VARRGQSMVEFALVAPVMLFLLFGVIESSLLLFAVGSAHFAAEEGTRVAAQLGNATNADTAAIQAVRTGSFGQTTVASITRVDIYRLQQQSNGTLTKDNAHINSYHPDGTPISVTWPPATRNVTSGQCDFLGLTIFYQYTWKSGVLLFGNTMSLTQAFDVRLEPQTY
jgi:Flp pilus assembly protein TadG